MDLNDLIKLSGIQNTQAPVQEQPVASSSDGMRTMIALVTPEQLNQLTGDAPVAEEVPGEATTEPNPQEYNGTLGSPSDNSLRRYLGAMGDHVTVDENVYPDHTVESVSEAYASFKAEGSYGKKKKYNEATKGCADCEYMKDETDGEIDTCDECAAEQRAKERNESAVPEEMNNSNLDDLKKLSGINPAEESVTEDQGKVGYMEMFFTDRDGGEVSQEVEVTLKDGKLDVTGPMPGPEDDLYWDDADIEEQLRDAMQDMSVISWMNEDTIDEADVEENAFNQAAAAAARAGKDSFEFGGKKHKTTMKKDTAHKLDDDIDVLKQLAGL